MSDENMQSETATEETVAAEKRTRLSPRTKAFDETVATITATVTDLEKQLDGANKTATAKLTAQIEVLSDLKSRVVEMSAEGPVVPGYTGKHYIGKLSSDGSLVAFDSNTIPTMRGFGPESKHGFATVWGSFRTKDGTALRVAKPEMLTEYTPVFSC